MRYGMLEKVMIRIVVILLIGTLCSCGAEKGQDIDVSQIRIYFSPQGGCTEAIVAELDKARSEIRIQAYSFTSKTIAKAVADAAKRGVRVEVILDKSNRSDKYGAGDFLAHQGIPTYIDDKHSIAHNKIMVIDRKTVITGSFNFTKAAEERNAENLLIIQDRGVAEKYRQNWQHHREHSVLYEGRQGNG